MCWRLAMFRIRERGRATKSPKAVRMMSRRFELFSSSRKLAMMGGPRSPITTKNAIVTPTRYPMIPSSIRSLPVVPKVWNAKFSKFLLLARRADLRSRWQVTFTRMPLHRIMTMARIIPHCLKQYGIERTATPIMEFASVITGRNDIFKC